MGCLITFFESDNNAEIKLSLIPVNINYYILFNETYIALTKCYFNVIHFSHKHLQHLTNINLSCTASIRNLQAYLKIYLLASLYLRYVVTYNY